MSEDFSLDSDSREETMRDPLWARAKYSKLYPELLNDQQAILILEKIEYDFTEIAKYLGDWRSLGLLARARSFDKAIKKFISRNPTATVINIGCGLDTTFSRVDNITINWYSID